MTHFTAEGTVLNNPEALVEIAPLGAFRHCTFSRSLAVKLMGNAGMEEENVWRCRHLAVGQNKRLNLQPNWWSRAL